MLVQNNDSSGGTIAVPQLVGSEPTYVSPLPWENKFDPILSMHCSDPRFWGHIKKFLLHHLGLRHPISLSFAGGPARMLERAPERRATLRTVRLHRDGHEVNRCIGIAHGGGCGYYRKHFPLYTPEQQQHQQALDLREWRMEILFLIPKATVEPYYALPVGDDVHFYAIP